jgi:glutaredoxin-like protein
MSLLNENIQKQVRQALAGLESPVKLVIFTQGEGPSGTAALECEMCADNRQLIEEVAALSDKLSVEVYDFVKDAEAARRYGIDKIPATVLVGDEDYGVRFFGIPAGYEFSSLIESIKTVSRRQPGLGQKTLEALSRLDRPAHIQVFVTPT